MNDERWTIVDRLLGEVLERAPHERAAFLREACGDDAALRRDVESLVAHAASGAGLLSTPALADAVSGGDSGFVGRQLGAYTLQALLGVGGMGEVYRARDGTLGRDVAIKILPRAFSSDPDRRARFDREARLLAALNHPHIGAIYGVDDSGGVRALVLELVEGDTLAERVAKEGPLPMREALTIARQIADALDAAHEKGITHRDLKPANIKITPDGLVKVLDFGLAKAASGDASSPDLTRSPTVTIGGTHEGTILGTAAYMSPEQARGKPIDKRTDVWAFGCVLFEMLTGRVAFAGDTLSDTIVTILEREPEWSALPATTPAPIRRLLLRCLDKDAKRRLRDIGDVRTEIDDVLSGGVSPLAPATVAIAPAPTSAADVAPALVKWRRGALMVLAVLMVVLVVASGVYLLLRGGLWSSSTPAGTTFSLQDAEPRQLTTTGNATLAALSPGGEWFAHVLREGDRDSLRIRQIATVGDREIAQSKPGATIVGVTVTPDGESVDYVEWVEEGKSNLWRVPVYDRWGPKLLIEDVHTPVAWSPNAPWRMAFIRRGTELIVAEFDGQKEKVLATRTLTDGLFVVIRQPGGSGNQRPAWSPDGKVIAAAAVRIEPVTGYWVFVDVESRGVRSVELSPPGNGDWLDNSSLIVNRSDGPGAASQGLWQVSSKGDIPPKRLIRDLTDYDGISLTRNRDTFATTRTHALVDIWVGDGSALRGLEEIPGSGAMLPIMRHGASVSWIKDRIWYSARDGDKRVLSSVSPGLKDFHTMIDFAEAPTGTSDGNRIVYVALQDNSLQSSDPDGRHPLRLADFAEWPLVRYGDREVIYSGRSEISGMIHRPSRVSIEGGRPTQIRDFGALTPDESSDGKRLAFVQGDLTHRFVEWCDLPDCRIENSLEMRGMVNSGEKGGRIRWSPGNKAIAYVRGDSPQLNIWEQPLDKRMEPVQLTDFKDDRRILDFAWSHDGRHFAAVRARISSDIVLFKIPQRP